MRNQDARLPCEECGSTERTIKCDCGKVVCIDECLEVHARCIDGAEPGLDINPVELDHG